MPQWTTCDPAERGETTNKTEMALAGGVVVATILWGWDGVSTPPSCDGPVVSIRVRNTSPDVTYYANLPNKRRGSHNIAIPPGTDTTLSGTGNLRNLGLETYTDCLGVTLHTEPLE